MSDLPGLLAAVLAVVTFITQVAKTSKVNLREMAGSGSFLYTRQNERASAAFQSDLTRVSTMILGREGSVRTYPEIDVPDPHHPLTHHRGHPDFIEKVTKINCYHVELFAKFVQKLKSIPEGDGTLLDHSAIIYGGALSDGNAHSNFDLPLLMAGHLGGATGGVHIASEPKTPVANLFVSLLNGAGFEMDKFADSTGSIALRV